MKKALMIFLLLVLLLYTICAEANQSSRKTYSSGNYSYVLLDDNSAEITHYLGFTNNLIIPSVLDGHVVTSIGDNAFNYSFIKTVNIPDSVQFIGANPFCGCNNLTTIIVSPDHPYFATIDGVLFSKADRRLICYPSTLLKTSYSIPNGIAIIGNDAFCNCSNLITVSIPNSITSIGNFAFDQCFSLTTISIPDSVQYIGENPFKGCYNLASIKISPDHPYLGIIDGILFSKADKRLIYCTCTFINTSYSIPDNIQIIGDYVFSDCLNLATITIPDSVTSIGNYTFLGCRNLKTVIIPNSITSIGKNAFYLCSSLTNVSIPNSVSSIGINAFALCSSLTDVIIPSNIKEGAFLSCTNLTTVTILDTVTDIGKDAFYNCSNLTTVIIPDSVTNIGDDAFDECPRLTSIIVGRNSYAKQYCIDNYLPYTYSDANDWIKGN